MIADVPHAARMLRVKLARAEVERLARIARLDTFHRDNRRLDGLTGLRISRGLRDLAGDELALALEAACE